MRHRPGDRYAEAGVDIDAGEALVEAIGPHARATHRPGVMAGLGGFGALFDLAACGLRDPLLVAGADGVGTKLLLGLEAGRLHDLGLDLVAMCVNDLVVQGAQPLFFLDYYATGRLDPAAAESVIAGIAAGCREAGCALIGGETAEMPGLYAGHHFDLAGFAVGAVERDALLPRLDAIAAGDVLIGLPSSGPHSNGYSLIRRILSECGAELEAAAPFDPAVTLAEALLAPTRIYARACLAAMRGHGVKALAHITGGGLLQNIPRVLPDNVTARLEAKRWRLPPVLAWLAGIGQLEPRDLARTFNCGLGMVLVVDAASVDAVTLNLRGAGEEPLIVGDLVAAEGRPRVELTGVEETWRAFARPS